MVWFLIGVMVFLLLLFVAYRWAAGEAPKGAFRGRGSFSGAGLDDQFRDDDPQSEHSESPDGRD